MTFPISTLSCEGPLFWTIDSRRSEIPDPLKTILENIKIFLKIGKIVTSRFRILLVWYGFSARCPCGTYYRPVKIVRSWLMYSTMSSRWHFCTLFLFQCSDLKRALSITCSLIPVFSGSWLSDHVFENHKTIENGLWRAQRFGQTMSDCSPNLRGIG